MPKLTKIVATIGPASSSEAMVEKLIQAGVNVFRFNFKHGEVPWHEEHLHRVKQIAERLGIAVGTLIDIYGPEVRIALNEESLELVEGERLQLKGKPEELTEKGLGFARSGVLTQLDIGQKVMIDDGEFETEVVDHNGGKYLQVIKGGKLLNKKSIVTPGHSFLFPELVEKDLLGIQLAKRELIDYIALSYVQTPKDLQILRSHMTEHDAKAQIVSKIESKLALEPENLEAIVHESDAVMVARGDMGVELPFEQVPYHKKRIIKLCVEQGKPVIVATQMLQSMIKNSHPTRAEVSDVADATYSFADAVMLSAESASGDHPLESVEAMARTVRFNEVKFPQDIRDTFEIELPGQTSMLADAAYDMSMKMMIKERQISGFVTFTQTGNSARRLAMFKPDLPIYALCEDQEVAESLTLNYGVYPFNYGYQENQDVEIGFGHIRAGLQFLKDRGAIEFGQVYIVMYGHYWGKPGSASTLKIVPVE